ncbi:SGNH/GDSL hydrolase family protein [Hymenobacter cheonanensis]|uniref:SGNH/GDSL hydrolase family protein n=1 Tax=Hymenobacter sp. CA2-7 TaxID=3063993 RepID=UPI0027141406|nr:SGNH/GDSL hydrolase family protein [Hymenobacter sp. CA2-7]MDO7884530.1 SGNH/GDSL hydrolase family protein [Hymenobacter sp. CA2-7]
MTTLFSAKTARPALALLGLGLGMAGCQPNLDAANPSPSANGLDFTSYVAVGNSLTSGYTDGGLFNEGQATSYPALLAQQFAKTGKGPASFVQPAFSSAKKDGSGYIKLQVVNGTLAPVQPTAANNYLGEQLAVTGVSLPGGPQLEAYSGNQPDNLGVPGISVLSSVSSLTGGLAPYGAINPFYERLLTTAEKTTKDYVTYIGQKTPTFFTCWMGNNDVLAYATAGGVVAATNPFGGLTDTTRFGIGYRAILQTISKGGTVKGAVANIPNVTSVPYFNTVTVAAVVAAYQAAGAPITTIYVQALNAAGTATAARAATSADLLTLTAQPYIATHPGVGTTPTNALPSDYVLDPVEAANVTARTTQLNAIIAKTALRFKVPVVDANAFLTRLATSGIATNGVNNTATFASGNSFGLDGVHPTPRGYAIIANEWIRVINSYYGSTVPQVDPNLYRGVLLP